MVINKKKHSYYSLKEFFSNMRQRKQLSQTLFEEILSWRNTRAFPKFCNSKFIGFCLMYAEVRDNLGNGQHQGDMVRICGIAHTSSAVF